jgi:uncharacterized protein YkwD
MKYRYFLLAVLAAVISFISPALAQDASQAVYLPLVMNPCPQGFPYVQPDDLQRELDMAAAINAERQSAGLAPLNLDERLTQAARKHSRDMADHHFVSHTGSDGSTPAERMTAACYDWSTWGETIGAGYVTVEDMLQAWMDSPDHRAILLDPDYADFGVGYAYNAENIYGHHWTVNLGR